MLLIYHVTYAIFSHRQNMTMSVYPSQSYKKKSIFNEQASSLRSTTLIVGSKISSDTTSGPRNKIIPFLITDLHTKCISSTCM